MRATLFELIGGELIIQILSAQAIGRARKKTAFTLVNAALSFSFRKSCNFFRPVVKFSYVLSEFSYVGALSGTHNG